jgi:hypothetical protein
MRRVSARAALVTTAGRRILVPGAVLLGFAIVQYLYLRPPSSRDGIGYFRAAAHFPDIAADHRTLRIGLLLPVRLAQTIFGHSEAAYYAVPLLAGAGLVLGTYAVGRILFGRAVGVGAALVLMLSDPFLTTSSLLLPDHVSAALFVAGLAAVLAVARRRAGGGKTDWRRGDHVALAGAGALLGWSYLVREYVALVFPLVVLVFALGRLPWRKLTWVAAPAAGLFVFELILNGVVYGVPWKRFVAAGGHGGERSYITDTRFDALVRLPRALADAPGGLVLAACLVLTLSAVALAVRHRHRRRSFVIVAAWFALLWLPLTLGTGLVVPSFRFVIADKLRYWMPVLPAIAIGGVAVVHRGASLLVERWPGPGRWRALAAPALVIAVAGAAALAGFSQVADGDSYRVNGADQLGDLRAWLAGDGRDVDTLWTDHYTARLLPLYTRTTFGRRVWDGEVRAFDRGFDRDRGFVEPRDLTRGAVVLHRFGYRLLPGGYDGIPGYLRRREGPDRTLEVFRDDRSLVVIRLSGS